MKIKDYKCKCGENDFFFDDKGNQKGIYCSYCGRWLKWASKDEQNLEMKQEPCEDTISRQAVLEFLKGFEILHNHDELRSNLIYGIMNLTPVAPQPKTGRWILKRTFPTKLYDEYLNEYKCSECYREIRCTESQLVNYPYCHCGAKMFEPQESEE